MGRETYFPQLAILVPERQSCACLRGQYTLRKIITRHSNHVPRLNLHSPRHRRCPTSRDFVPWRFLDAGRHSAWKGSSCRRPKTCTNLDFADAHCSTCDSIMTLTGPVPKDHLPWTARVINLHESLRRQFVRNESSNWTSAKERDDVECEPSAPHDHCSSVVVRRKCVSLGSGLIEFGDITTVLG